MAQWVKNPTAAAWVAVEVRVWFLARHNGLKHPALPHLWCRSQLHLETAQKLAYAVSAVIKLKKKKKVICLYVLESRVSRLLGHMTRQWDDGDFWSALHWGRWYCLGVYWQASFSKLSHSLLFICHYDLPRGVVGLPWEPPSQPVSKHGTLWNLLVVST